jgi:hypothetical protein
LIKLTLDDEAVRRRLQRLASVNLKPATRAVLERARKRVIAELPRYFTLRGSYIARGFRIRDTPKGAQLSHRDSFMALHAKGGTKTSREGQLLAIPVGARSTKQTTTPPAKWPEALLKQAGFYIREIGPGTKGVFWRDPNQRRGKGKLMYILKKSVKIKKTWPFFETVRKVLRR